MCSVVECYTGVRKKEVFWSHGGVGLVQTLAGNEPWFRLQLTGTVNSVKHLPQSLLLVIALALTSTEPRPTQTTSGQARPAPPLRFPCTCSEAGTRGLEKQPTRALEVSGR